MPALPSPPFKAQDQRSVTDQLRDLVVLATREGFYDAADLIQDRLLKPVNARVTTAEILVALADKVELTDEVRALLATPRSDDTEKG